MGNKNIWECHITIHASIKEKTNSILLSIARDKDCKKSRVIQELLDTHPEYLKKMEQMEKESYFI